MANRPLHAPAAQPGSLSATLALVLVLLVTLVASLLPLKLAGSWEEVKAALAAGMTLSIHGSPAAVLGERLALFLPLGLLMHRQLVGLRWGRPGLASSALLILFALSIELLQAVVSARHPVLSDFLLASVAGLAGITLSAGMSQGGPGLMRRLLPGLLVLGNLITVTLIAIPHSSAGLIEWDCEHPLLIANELGRDRPWLGRIRGMAIYPRRLARDEIRRLSQAPMTRENMPLRRQAGAAVLYRFANIQAGRVLQLAERAPAMDLLVTHDGAASWQIEDDAMAIRKPIRLHSIGPATSLCKAIASAQAFTVEVEMASAGLDDDGGWARILSIPSSTEQRNLTLTEHAGELVLRVRTPREGLNWALRPLRSDRRVLSGDWQNIIASYGAGAARLFVDAVEVSPAVRYRVLTLSGKQPSSAIAAFALCLFPLMGAAVGRLRSGRPFVYTLMWAFCTVSLAPLLFYLGLSVWQRQIPDGMFVATASFGPLLGLSIIAAWQRRLAPVRG